MPPSPGASAGSGAGDCLARRDIREVLRKLESDERQFTGQLVVAPVIATRTIAVRISEIWCRLAVGGLPEDFQGFGVFEALSASAARFLRLASLQECQRFLHALPSVRFLVLGDGTGWPANSADSRFRWRGPVPLLLADPPPPLFETAISRFDGRVAWFERLDSARDPSIAAYLREQLLAPVPVSPDSLRRTGLSRDERLAYAELLRRRIESERPQAEKLLRRALEHGGAELVDYSERDGAFYTVRFRLEDREYVSAVRAADLTLVSAGICLAGEDAKFDLASLASVLREARGDE